jgi:hypothetical protein
MTSASLIFGFLFGSIGLGLFIYGRKQKVIVPLLCGMALMVYPYFVTNLAAMIAIGCALIAIPYFFRV